MFIGQMSDWTQQSLLLPRPFCLAINEVWQSDLSQKPAGRYDLTSVPDSFFLLQEGLTKKIADTRPEAHQSFTDIQLLLSGEEKFGFAQSEQGLAPLEDSFAEKDIAFYPTPKNEAFVTLTAGQYIIFAPAELHRPQCCVDNNGTETPAAFRKVVIKIKG